MSTSSRQNSLLVAEDWKKIYQTFREADFQSYDFETLRKSMIDYIKLYYPEDFNDFIESSEYIALIDLIAFLGQSLSYRTDLNARENFLDTAERRDSILKLARLVSYTPKRSNPASGILKINAIASSEKITDSSGNLLTNVLVTWNDATNSNWLEQFTLIMNATLTNSQVVGKSGNSQVINSIKTDEYTVNLPTNSAPVFSYSSIVNSTNVNFEVVSATSVNQPYIYEVEPKASSKFNLLYRNDNQGNSSINTGFFLFFKQGQIKSMDFNLSEALPNRLVSIDFDNINNTDIWLYGLDNYGKESTLWKSTPAISGVNVVYNKTVERNLYQVLSKADDKIDLVFGDGSFSNIPQGTYRIYFRVGNNLTYKITPDEMQDVAVTIPYVSRSGNLESMTIRASLNYTVTNASANESIDDIRQRAPQQYYTQGRMITGEDYNIVPYTTFSNILKVKAVNRTSSGISRYLDVSDVTGKYSSTNIFAQDGYLYKENTMSTITFSFLTTSNVQQIVQDDLSMILNSREIQHFHYANFTRYTVPDTIWSLSSKSTNNSTGYFFKWGVDNVGDPIKIISQSGYVTSSQSKYIRVGAIVKFGAPAGFYFNTHNQIVAGVPRYTGDKLFMYASVMQVAGDGTNGGIGNFANGTGPVTLSQQIPNGALIIEVMPVFKNSLPQQLVINVSAKVIANNNFALRYDLPTQEWTIVEEKDVNYTHDFSLTKSNEVGADPSVNVGDTTGQHKDASWLIRFEYSPNVGYSIYWRGLNYFFESKLETKFYFDEKMKVYDSKSGTVLKDQIKVLKVNTSPNDSIPLGVDYTWYIAKNIVENDGYVNQSKVLVTFTDVNADGIPDNPDIFDIIVDPVTEPEKKLVYFRNDLTYDSFTVETPVDMSTVVSDYATQDAIVTNASLYIDGQLFYAYADEKFFMLSVVGSTLTLVEQTNYVAKIGRENLYFQYRHNSPGYRRIDPSPNNIIDLFMLIQSYATDYQNWIRDTTNTLEEPIPPSTEQLKLEYSSLENFKAISDSIIYNSARFKPLFGTKSEVTLQAVFKVVKNSAVNVSDNDIKSSVINAINTYFAIDNWDFGETFYFSELSAYLHSTLSPNVSSIIIVPLDPTSMFGNLYQINAEANEILVSSATVDNVEIISAITAASINANFAGVNTVSTSRVTNVN